MSYSITGAAQLLVDNFSLLEGMNCDDGVLDLACGRGRNGLFLAERNIAVTFADHNESDLQQVAEILKAKNFPGCCRLVDLEAPNRNPLADSQYDGILVFNYLHRPLMPSIKRSTNRGGLIFYETFTVDQPRFGRPVNPDFLLEPGELLDCFGDWDVLHYFEGIKQNPERSVASVIVRRPQKG